MDRNTITAFLLIGLILILFQVVNRPTEQQIQEQKEKQRQEQLAQQQQQSTNPNTASAPAPSTASSEEVMKMFNQPNEQQAGTKTTLENDQFILTFNSKGGTIERVELKDYKTASGEPVVLLEEDPENQFTYQFFIKNSRFSTQDFNFQVAEQNAQGITYRLSAGDGGYIEQKYTLDPADPYMVDYDLNIVGLQGAISGNEIDLKWIHNLIQQEEDTNNERIKSAIYFMDKDDDLDYIAERTDDEKAIGKQPVKWLSMKQQFFNTTLVPTGELRAGNIASKTPAVETDETLKTLTADLYIPYDHSQSFSYPMSLYLGPNHYNTLKAKGKGMEQIVYMGWTIFRWVNLGLIVPIFNFLNKFISSYGIIILLLTLLIKMVLFPLTYRSYRSMAKMNVLKPEIDEIKQKFPEDAQRQQQETMKLYSNAGVNPLGGCLPQMLQMPILIAMYYFFPSAIELRQESFLWAHDLSTYDSIMNLPFTIPFYGAHVSLFTLLSAGASLAYTQMNSQMQANSNPQMKVMQYIMPAFLIFIFNSFPAALTYYFFLSNLITYGQQFIIKKFFINEDKLRAEIKDNAKKPKKKSAFQQQLQQMLEEAQQKQQQQQKEQQQKKKTRRK